MSELPASPASGPARRRRADAERSRAAILEAAIRLLGERPDASVEAIAAAAGLTRQTVYAHYATREALLDAVVGRITDEALAAIDAADLDAGPAPAALLRLLDASWQTFARHPIALRLGATSSSQESRDHHEPVADRLARLIRRGQEAGEFDRRLSPGWLIAATFALGHAAGDEVVAGRIAVEDAVATLGASVLRVYGADDATWAPQPPAPGRRDFGPTG